MRVAAPNRKWLLAAGLIAAGCRSPWNELRPMIHATSEAKAAAMRSAPIVLVGEIRSARLYSQAPKEVEKPAGVAGPMTPRIPLHLAILDVKVLLALRGPVRDPLRFYVWTWASGKHGGPRLFHPQPGSVHVLFLREEAGYLHSVGDYPAYDLELRSPWVAGFLLEWRAGFARELGLIERIVATRLKAELLSATAEENEYSFHTYEEVELTDERFVGDQLASLCQHLANPLGRARACVAYKREFAPEVSAGGQ
jgi:hypothetical protein